MKVPLMVSALILSLCLSACAHLGSLDKTVYSLTEQVVTATESLHTAKVITDAQFRQANVPLNKVAVAGSAFNKVVRYGNAKPVDASALLTAVRQAIAQLKGIAAGPFAKVLETLTTLDHVVSDFMGSTLAGTITAGGQ